jgi:hypothetical protein
MPSSANAQDWVMETPEEITPQVKAHIGANQVTGLSSSRTARGSSRELTG